MVVGGGLECCDVVIESLCLHFVGASEDDHLLEVEASELVSFHLVGAR